MVFHELAHLQAAVAATKRPLLLLSPPGAALIAGAPFYAAMLKLAKPPRSMLAAIDCADDAALAHEALRTGWRAVVYTGRPAVRAKLEAIAAPLGATVLRRRPPALDLAGHADPAAALAGWLA